MLVYPRKRTIFIPYQETKLIKIMIITIISDVLGEANNGTSLAAFNLINYLKSKGHQVRVVCPDESRKGMEGFYIIPTINFWIFNNYVKHNGVTIAKPDEEILSKAIDGADIVHSLLPFAAGRAAARYCAKHHIPFTSGFHAQAENLTSHFYLMNVKFANGAVYRNFWKHYYCLCDAIHYPTTFIRDYVNKYMNGPKAYAISNGVDTRLFNTNIHFEKPEHLKDKFIVIMAGRLSAEKKQIMLLKASRILKHKDNIQIILAGGGPKDLKLKRYVKRHLKDNPAIIKCFKHEELHEALNYSDLYVHSSLVEIEAISCLEALACGLVPVISNSPRSATSKFALTDHSSFKYNSYKDLAKQIDYWYEHPKERKEASIKYAEFAKQFDIDLCMEKMEKMLIEVSTNYTGEKSWLKKR